MKIISDSPMLTCNEKQALMNIQLFSTITFMSLRYWQFLSVPTLSHLTCVLFPAKLISFNSINKDLADKTFQ